MVLLHQSPTSSTEYIPLIQELAQDDLAHLRAGTADVAVLKLQLPANQNLQYRAGQYVEFILRDGARLGPFP